MISPCCFGITLKRGVTVVALFELAMNSLTAISTVIFIASTRGYYKARPYPGNSDANNKLSTTTVSTPSYVPGKEINGLVTGADEEAIDNTGMVFLLILLVGEIALSWILYRGASKEKFRHLRTWWWIKLVMMVLFLVFDMVEVFSGENRKLEFVVCAQVLYQGYVLWMVKALIDEIRGIGPPRFTQLTQPKVSIEVDPV